jgi:hypothetical protein
VRAGHERPQLFARGLDELDPVAVLAEAAEDAVDAVAGVPVDLPHAVLSQPLEDVRANRLSPGNLASAAVMAAIPLPVLAPR